MITIVDYQAGNLSSVQRALKELGFNALVSHKPADILKATKVIFPGVGAAGQAMHSLQHLELVDALKTVAKQGKGLLGICLGAQIILEKSQENATRCLGILPGQAKLLPVKKGLKIPHMGWNQVVQKTTHPLFAHIPDQAHFYFVHSYYPQVNHAYILGETDYGLLFPSVIGHNNILAVQFHAEKSGKWGLQLLNNFLTMEF